MTIDLDELERKAKAVIASNANLPDGEPPYSMGLAASDVLALIERVRDVEAEKAADAERAEYWRVEAKRVHAEALAKANERVRKLEKKLAEAPDNWENGEAFEKDINA